MMKELKELSKECVKEMQKNVEMKLTRQDEKRFYSAKCCHICNKPFDDSDVKLKRVRDHCHRTGQYRGAAHNKCNINYFSERYLPIIFHNLRGYDGHLIIQEVIKIEPNSDISVIPNSYEKFVSFKIGKMKFIDSFQFMSSSIEKLTETLYNKTNHDKYEKFYNMKNTFLNIWIYCVEKVFIHMNGLITLINSIILDCHQ